MKFEVKVKQLRTGQWQARYIGGKVETLDLLADTQEAVIERMREPAAAGLYFRPIGVHSDKMVRANPWLARAEQGKVVLVRGPWVADFLNEVCAFPEAEHDDQVDAVSGAVQMLARMGGVSLGAMSEAQERLSSPSRWTTRTTPRWKRSQR